MADGAQHSFDDANIETGSGRAVYPPEAWEAARADYLAGLSGAEVCVKHGMGLSSLRRHAAAEGWRRQDQAMGRVFDEGDELSVDVCGDLDLIEYRQLAHVAHRRMMRAVLRGAASEALRWKRVADLMEAEQQQLDRFIEKEEAWEQANAAAAAIEWDSRDS